MLGVASDWRLDVDRGPDWLFIRVRPPEEGMYDAVPLAEQVWAVLRQHFVYRVVLELDEIKLLHSHLVGQLVLLMKRVHSHGGLMRISGLSPRNQDVLHSCRLDNNLPTFDNRTEAVKGVHAQRPR